MAKAGFYQQQEWKTLRRKVMQHWKANGLPCAYCNEPIDWTQRWSSIADHINPIRKAPHLALEPSNICMMHYGCHTKKTAYVDNPVKAEISPSGFPIGSEWE